MKLRLALLAVALPLALALVGTQSAAASTGPEAARSTQADAAATTTSRGHQQLRQLHGHRDVAADGTVVGRYWSPGNAPPNRPNQNLGPLRYQQPTDCGA
jgi:hypothetical protein